MKADASGLPVRAVSDLECAARGAAMLAGVGDGTFADHASVPGPRHEPDIHRPSTEGPIYQQLYYEVHEPLRKQLRRRRSTWSKARQIPSASDV
jgi:sugar (pentulose or hexulose) kinase